MESVYIHIPFCKSICSYCDFCKVLYHGPWVTSYLNKLVEEIKEKYQGETIKTLYIGGGTPSALGSKDLKYLMDIIKVFDLRELEEFTFECNIGDINTELLTILKENNVNRLSIGIESFNHKKLDFMKREILSFKEVKDKIKLCRDLGFNNINVDLIYGIPKETDKVLKSDIKNILKLDVEHISTYSLIVEDNTMIKDIIPIDEDTDAFFYELIKKKLKSKGYIHYEVSNFAKVGFESKHNLNYWDNNEYYGFGVGASGYIGNVRYTNTKSITKYLDGKFNGTEEILSRDDVMANELMLGFRKLKGINLQEFFNKYGVNLQEVFKIQKYLDSKDIIYKDGYLFINSKKIYVMNEILIHII